MSVIKQPIVTVNKLPASLPAGLDTQKILVIGQKLSTGTAIEKTLITNVDESDINDKFGEKSALGCALRAMFEEFEQCAGLKYPRIDVIALEDDGGATKAEATIALAASGGDDTINKACTLEISIGGKDVSVDIAVGDSITADVAPALEAAINASDLPITATDDGSGNVELEYNQGGTIGNNTTIKIDGLAKVGSDYFLSNMKVTVTAFAGGATDPTTTNLLDIVDNIRYQTLTYPYEYGTDLATDFLDPRFNVTNDIKDGVAILKTTDSKADFLVSGALLNSQSLVLLTNKETTDDNFDGGEDLEIDYVASARVAALRGLRLTDGANIINITPASTDAPNDALGGAHIASLPYANTPVTSPLQPEGEGWTSTEIEELAAVGLSVMGNNKAGNQVILNKVLTTYKTDIAGNTDLTWRYLNTVDTMSVCCEYIFNNLKVDYIQTRLTQGNIIRGYNMTNRQAFISKLQEYYLALANIALVPKSKAALKFFTDSLLVVLDTVDGKITASGDLPIVVQLREIIVNLKTNFGSSLV